MLVERYITKLHAYLIILNSLHVYHIYDNIFMQNGWRYERCKPHLFLFQLKSMNTHTNIEDFLTLRRKSAVSHSHRHPANISFWALKIGKNTLVLNSKLAVRSFWNNRVSFEEWNPCVGLNSHFSLQIAIYR